jgi:hypothetical protein
LWQSLQFPRWIACGFLPPRPEKSLSHIFIAIMRYEKGQGQGHAHSSFIPFSFRIGPWRNVAPQGLTQTQLKFFTRKSCSVTWPLSIKSSTSLLMSASVFEFAIPA